jgi:hypothetical protein
MFGELRSLLHVPERDELWRQKICVLLELAQEEDPTRYEQQWLPYLSGCEDHWDDALREVTSL